MGFKLDGYAKVWKVEDKGNYHVVQMSTSKKNTQTGSYETDFSNNFVRFIGTAHTQAKTLNEGDRIKIGSCEVTSKYDKVKQKDFVNYLVFSFEKVDGNNSENKPATTTSIIEDAPVEDELPFN